VGRTLGTLAVLVAGLLLAGCGGGGSSTTSSSGTTTSATASATDWANGVCSAFSTWVSALKPISQNLQSNPTKSNLEAAGNDVKDANQALVDDLKSLGKPESSRGAEAKNVIDTLAGEIKTDTDQISSALTDVSGVSGIVSAASVVSSTLITMGTQVEESLNQLASIDKDQGGALEQAFSDASACKSLQKSNS
jgi:hypothetical protein